jgi:hypothetical protein
VADGAQPGREVLDDVAAAVGLIGRALAAIGEAYEQLDEHSADRVEEELFRPVQTAYGRAQRAHVGFAERRGLPRTTFEAASAGLPSQGVKGFLEGATDALAEADRALAELQDAMLEREIGDTELRSALAEVRRLIGDLPRRARELGRTFGR